MTSKPENILTSQTPDNDWYRKRLMVAVWFIIPVFAVLLLRLFYLQIIEGDTFRKLSENNCIRLQTIDPPRGLIFDRNGILLVDNRPSYDLGLVVRDASPLDITVQNLSSILMLPENEIMELIHAKNHKHHSPYNATLIQSNIGRNTLAYLESNRYSLPGIVVDVRLRRQYVYPHLASHVLGYIGEINSGELKGEAFADYRPGDVVGKFGVERSFEVILKGQRGGRQIEVNSSGRLVNVLSTVTSVPGQNIYLSIDKSLQEKAETLLSDATGALVAMNPNTGHILALASSPTFDQNAFIDGMSQEEWDGMIKNPMRPLLNKAIQGEYPPASTYKIICAIAGLEDGVIDERTTFFCPGHLKYGNREYRCWKKGGHGTVNITDAIAESCDVFFYQTGLKLGVDRLAFYAKAFGLGSRTGIQLDGEAGGLVPTTLWKKRKTGVLWQGGETLSVAIGQGYNLVTPLQMAVVMSAIANGGFLVTPLIVNRIENADGEVVDAVQPVMRGRIPLKTKTMQLVQKGLWEVVNGNAGTARIAKINGIDISGKTGTAQVFSRKSGSVRKRGCTRNNIYKSHAWFVAYAPSASPQLVVSVIVEHGEHGSSAAAPTSIRAD